MRRFDFFQDAFTKCVHIRKLEVPGYIRSKAPLRTKKTKYLFTVICPEKFKLVHNKEVTELGRTRAGILKPMLDRTLVASQFTKI